MSFWCLQNLPNTDENMSTWVIIVVKLNFFVRFLEELRISKSPFEINWPLDEVEIWNFAENLQMRQSKPKVLYT